jgi:Universal stress protein UspA and related nucleotide-binding proteins
MIAIRKILVATDFGEPSEAALRYGRALAQRFGAALHVLHVTENLLAAALAGEYTAAPAEIQEDLERVAQQRTEALLTDEDRRTLKAVAVTMNHGSPAVAIVEYAKTAPVDLIVLGTHGRGAVAHLFLGNVAERVVRAAPCPVLTVRHPEHEFVLPDALVAVSRA